MARIIIKDDEKGEIAAIYSATIVRTWAYKADLERGAKLRAAHEFSEGWYQATNRAAAIALGEYDEAPIGSYDNGGTQDGWRMACTSIERKIRGENS